MSLDELAPSDLSRFADVFTLALRGHPCWARHDDGPVVEVPVRRWTAIADPDDEAFLEHCTGPTLDIGCGPGRMAARLAELDQPALGVDVVDEAVQLTRARGASAVVADIFDFVPGEGRWAFAILADGNIGIGGDPIALLTRVRTILAPGGRAVVEVEPPGTGHRRSRLVIGAAGLQSEPLAWALVGADAVASLARETGFDVEEPPHAHGHRWCTVLRVTS